MATDTAAAERIDWSQLWYPGPRRRFTDAEMARAGGDRPSRTFAVMLTITLSMVAQGALQAAPAGEVARLAGLLVAAYVWAWYGALRLWAEPARRTLMRETLLVAGVFLFFALGLRWRMAPGVARDWIFHFGAAAFGLITLTYWFVTVFRAHQIEARLREHDERERALELARQLATAQVQPHFLFNSLASLQHWVDTRDERAGPMLAALTGYLRATLPLFERRVLPLADELQAVQRYLDVMRLRLGERLASEVHADPAALAVCLPPGVLLTLVENAIEHGVSPRLGGGRVTVRCTAVAGGGARVEVVDDGPGLPPELPAAPPAGGPTSAGGASSGVGLANTRARLAQAFGPRARLQLANAPDGGCVATIDLPAPDIPVAPALP